MHCFITLCNICIYLAFCCCDCLGPFFSCVICRLMDPTKIIYVVTSDDDLPVSMQLLRSNGTLQPQILPPKSSAPFASSAITVYDSYGNDIAEDVAIETYEYSVDENGEVWQLNNTPNTVLSSNSLASVNNAECIKSTSEEFAKEPNLVTNLKVRGVQMTLSRDSSHTYLPNVQHNGQESEKIDGTLTESESLPVSDSCNSMTTNCCVKPCLVDSTFPASTVEMTADTIHNSDTTSAVYKENPLSICTNNSPLSHSLHSGNCSVPSLPQNLFCGIPDDISQLTLAADRDCRTTPHLSECLSDAVKCTTMTTDTAVASCKVNTTFTNVSGCDAISSLTIKHLQPCVSFPAECCLNSCSCKHNSISQQSASQSELTELNNVSAACSLTNSSYNVNSMPICLSSVTSTGCIDNEANSFSCKTSRQTDASLTEIVVDCKLDSSECHFAHCVYRPTVRSGSDSAEHSSCSCTAVAESSFCKTEQHPDDLIVSLNIINHSPSDLSISGVTVSKPNYCNVNECSQTLTMPDHGDLWSNFEIPSSDSERAEQCVSETEMLSSSSISVDVTDYDKTECLFLSASYGGSSVDDSLQQMDVASQSSVMNTNGRDDADSNKQEMLSSSSISVDVEDHSEPERPFPSATYDDHAVEDCVERKDFTSSIDVMNIDDPDGVDSDKREIPSISSISVGAEDCSETERSFPSASSDGIAVEDSVQQKDVASLSVVMNTNGHDDVDINKQELLLSASISVDVEDHSETERSFPSADYDDRNSERAEQCVSETEMLSSSSISVGVTDHDKTECLFLSASYGGSAVDDSLQQMDVASQSGVMNTNGRDNADSNKQEMLSSSSISVDVEDHIETERSFPSADYDDSAVNNSVEQKGCTSSSDVMNTDGPDSVDSDKREISSISRISVGVEDCNETERSFSSANSDGIAVEDSVQQKDVALVVMNTNGHDDVDNNKQELLSSSSISVDVEDHSETERSFPSADYDDSAVEDCVQQKDVASLGGAMNTGDLDSMSTDKREQNFSDTVTTDCMLQPHSTRNCVEMVNSNSNSTLASCSVSETVNTDVTDSVVHIMDQEFDETDGNVECHLQLPCTTSHTYNGCQQDLLKALRDEVHELRQKLCTLHRTKHCLKKLQRYKPPVVASNTDRSQTDRFEDLLHDANCSKRLRLEVIDQELAHRAVLLQQREDQMDLRLQRIEEREQALREKEQLLLQAQYYIFVPPQQEVMLMTGVQLEPVQKLPTIEQKSDDVEPVSDQMSTFKHMPQRRRSCRHSKQKVFLYCWLW